MKIVYEMKIDRICHGESARAFTYYVIAKSDGEAFRRLSGILSLFESKESVTQLKYEPVVD